MPFNYGLAAYPLPTVTSGSSLLKTCDPALAKILDFLKFAIETYAGDAIESAASLSKAPIASAVVQVAGINPGIIAKMEQWPFPSLFGWRTKAKHEGRTFNWVEDVSNVSIAYILPPLNASQSILFLPLLTSIAHVCHYALKAGHDPAYNSDERIVVDNGMTSARLLSGEYGAFQFEDAKDSYFPSWVGEIELIEQTLPNTTGVADLVATDFTITNQNTNGAPDVPVTILQFDTDHP
jgi:hypothetical protein